MYGAHDIGIILLCTLVHDTNTHPAVLLRFKKDWNGQPYPVGLATFPERDTVNVRVLVPADRAVYILAFYCK